MRIKELSFFFHDQNDRVKVPHANFTNQIL